MTKIRFSTTHSDGSVITYAAPVVAVEISDKSVWVEIPFRMRKLPFPPYNGKRFVQIPSEYAQKWSF